MFNWKHATTPAPRYQTIRGAHSTARHLTPWLHSLLRHFDQPITLTELAQATHLSVGYIEQVVNYLCAHALVRPVEPSTRWRGQPL